MRAEIKTPHVFVVCASCGRREHFAVARLLAQHWDASMPGLLPELTRCPKWKSRAHYGGPEATGSSLRHVDVQQPSVSRGLSTYSGQSIFKTSLTSGGGPVAASKCVERWSITVRLVLRERDRYFLSSVVHHDRAVRHQIQPTRHLDYS